MTASEPLWRTNVSLLTTGAVSLLFVLRVYAVAGGHPVTARAILAAAGPAEVAFGLVLTSGVAFILGALWGVTFRRLALIHSSEAGYHAALAMALFSSLSLLFFVTIAFGVFSLVALGAIEATRNRSAPPASPLALASAISPLLVFVALGLLALFTVADTKPWMPPHKLDVQGEAPMTAFVLRATEAELEVLIDRGRRVETFDRSKATDRGLCERPSDRGPWILKSLVGLTNRTRYQSCPVR